MKTTSSRDQLKTNAAIAYDKAKKADDAFQAALQKEYGKAAGDIRYQPQKQTPEIRLLGSLYQLAIECWRVAYRAIPVE